MKKTNFVKKLGDVTGLNKEQCETVNEILEGHFVFGKRNKAKITKDVQEKLDLATEAAEKVYEDAMSLVGGGLKDKLKQLFGQQK